MIAMAKRNSISRDGKIREGLGIWTAFYRANPHRFAVDYLGMRWMTPIQKIILNLILKFTYALIIASRGMGKTMLVAAAICVKCILYPGIQVVIAAGNRGQSINVLNKIIDEYLPNSVNLQNEIETYKATPADAYITFKNGSIVKVVTARDSARSARANWIINDEFVQIKKTVIDGVLRKFKAGLRTPGFYEKKQYKDYPKEPNCETYISSAYYKFHYSWNKFKAYFKSMAKGENYVCVGFPYQLPVSQGYYPPEQIREEMQESDFDPIKFSMEMESLFFGEASNAFYSYTDLEINRTIERPVYPPHYYQILGDPKWKYPEKQDGEIRIIGMDIATQGGSKNDNTCFSVLSLIPNRFSQYDRSLIFIDVMNGGHTADQSLRLRRMFEDFQADFVVIDTNGVGLGVYDLLVREQVDEDRNTVYKAWNCVNDPKMAERCNDPDAPKIIYSIKATSQFNSDAAVLLRDCLKRNKLRLLISEIDAVEILMNNRQYNKMSAEDQMMFQTPYYNTTMLINETINLSYEMVNGKIRVSEQAGMRKDRYSSVSYANYIASELEREFLRNNSRGDFNGMFKFRSPVIK